MPNRQPAAGKDIVDRGDWAARRSPAPNPVKHSRHAPNGYLSVDALAFDNQLGLHEVLVLRLLCRLGRRTELQMESESNQRSRFENHLLDVYLCGGGGTPKCLSPLAERCIS